MRFDVSITDFMHLPLGARVFIIAMFAPVIWATALAIAALMRDVGRYFTNRRVSRVTGAAENTRVTS
jgi:hypothetical protein